MKVLGYLAGVSFIISNFLWLLLDLGVIDYEGITYEVAAGYYIPHVLMGAFVLTLAYRLK